jgi:hypothetical protein
MGRPDNKWDNLTTNGKTRKQKGKTDNNWEALTTNGKT